MCQRSLIGGKTREKVHAFVESNIKAGAKVSNAYYLYLDWQHDNFMHFLIINYDCIVFILDLTELFVCFFK